MGIFLNIGLSSLKTVPYLSKIDQRDMKNLEEKKFDGSQWNFGARTLHPP